MKKYLMMEQLAALAMAKLNKTKRQPEPTAKEIALQAWFDKNRGLLSSWSGPMADLVGILNGFRPVSKWVGPGMLGVFKRSNKYSLVLVSTRPTETSTGSIPPRKGRPTSTATAPVLRRRRLASSSRIWRPRCPTPTCAPLAGKKPAQLGP